MEHVSKCLGWKPISVCEKTLKVTTQYAKNYLCLPMRDHYKAQFPALNCKHLNKIYATDTFFALSKALCGYMCAQLYVGKTSMLTEAFGMKSENEMKDTLQDFIRKWGPCTCYCQTMPSQKLGTLYKKSYKHTTSKICKQSHIIPTKTQLSTGFKKSRKW